MKRASSRYNASGLSDDVAAGWSATLAKDVETIAEATKYTAYRLDEVRAHS